MDARHVHGIDVEGHEGQRLLQATMQVILNVLLLLFFFLYLFFLGSQLKKCNLG